MNVPAQEEEETNANRYLLTVNIYWIFFANQ